MFYLVTYKTNEIIRDDSGRPIITKSNDNQEISAAIKQYGALWVEPIPCENFASLTVPVHAKLTEEDLEWLNIAKPETVIPKIKQNGGLFDFM